MSVSAPSAMACATTIASFLVLLPPKPKEIASSRLTRIRDSVPRAARRRPSSSTGDGSSPSASARMSSARRSALEWELVMITRNDAGKGEAPSSADILREPWHLSTYGEGKARRHTRRSAPALASRHGDLRHRAAPAVAGDVDRRHPGPVRSQARAAYASAHHAGRVVRGRTDRSHDDGCRAPGCARTHCRVDAANDARARRADAVHADGDHRPPAAAIWSAP